MADSVVRGAADLQRVARELKAAGDGKLRREALKGIRKAAEPGIPAVRASALAVLPKRGGLAAEVAGQPYVVRSSLPAGRVRIQSTRGMKELLDIDKGHVRHPTFAHRRSLFSGNTTGAGLMIGRRSGEWHSQAVPEGFFTKPLERLAPPIRLAVLRVIADIAKQIH